MNKLWRLARKPPGGWPVAEDFAWSEAPDIEPQAGQALTRTIYVSMDPYQWGRRRGGVEQPGEVCHGRTVAQVVASRHERFVEGDFVFGIEIECDGSFMRREIAGVGRSVSSLAVFGVEGHGPGLVHGRVGRQALGDIIEGDGHGSLMR